MSLPKQPQTPPRRLIDSGSPASALLAAAREASAEAPPGSKERIWRALQQGQRPAASRLLWPALFASTAAAAVAAVLFFRAAVPPPDVTAPAAVAELSGRADVTPEGGVPIEASVGSPLPAHASVDVRQGGEAVVRVGAARAAVGPGSRIALSPRGTRALIGLDHGSLGVLASGTRSITVIAAGPYLIEAISALFIVRSEAGRVSVHVERGEVRVKTAAGDVEVGSGRQWANLGSTAPDAADRRLGQRAAGEPVPPLAEGPRAGAVPPALPGSAPAPAAGESRAAAAAPKAADAAPTAPPTDARPARSSKRVRVARAPERTSADPARPATALADTDEALHSRAHELERTGRYAEAAGAYAALSRRRSSRAETALYELGRVRAKFLKQPQSALEALEEYQRRYPNGALALEAALTTVEAQLAQGRGDPALAAMNKFLGRFGDSERAADVRWLRAALLVERGECGAARADLRALAEEGQHASDAVFALASCARSAGDLAEAKSRLEEYLQRFPEAPRRAEALRALGGERTP